MSFFSEGNFFSFCVCVFFSFFPPLSFFFSFSFPSESLLRHPSMNSTHALICLITSSQISSKHPALLLHSSSISSNPQKNSFFSVFSDFSFSKTLIFFSFSFLFHSVFFFPPSSNPSFLFFFPSFSNPPFFSSPPRPHSHSSMTSHLTSQTLSIKTSYVMRHGSHKGIFFVAMTTPSFTPPPSFSCTPELLMFWCSTFSFFSIFFFSFLPNLPIFAFFPPDVPSPFNSPTPPTTSVPPVTSSLFPATLSSTSASLTPPIPPSAFTPPSIFTPPSSFTPISSFTTTMFIASSKPPPLSNCSSPLVPSSSFAPFVFNLPPPLTTPSLPISPSSSTTPSLPTSPSSSTTPSPPTSPSSSPPTTSSLSTTPSSSSESFSFRTS